MPRPKRTWFTRFRVILAASALLLVLFLVGIVRETINRYQIKNEIKGLEGQVKRLEGDNTGLSSMITAWTSGNQLEEEARLKLGLQKPGENVVLVQRNEETSTSSMLIGQKPKIVGNIVVESELDQSNWSNPLRWWHYFFK
ncbi:MAG: septum formation initiator family protein [Patescibacteria group bacterium]